jgi:hypothetical protein
MAGFNLADYETVEERLKRFYKDNPDGRVITKNITTLQDRQVSTWVVQAEIWLPAWKLDKAAKEWFIVDRDSHPWYLKATGLAFEVDGQGMANKTSALENAETSAIGRALANAGYSGNKRTSRQEMEKVARGATPKATSKDWLAMATELGNDIEGLRLLYSQAKTANATAATLTKIQELATANGQTSEQDTPMLNS